MFEKQVGNGISRRHTSASKIAQGLQSVKYSLLQYPKNIKLDRTGALKGETLWSFLNIHSAANYLKN